MKIESDLMVFEQKVCEGLRKVQVRTNIDQKYCHLARGIFSAHRYCGGRMQKQIRVSWLIAQYNTPPQAIRRANFYAESWVFLFHRQIPP